MLSILLTKCLLRARRLSFSAGTVSVGWSTRSSCEIWEEDLLPRQILCPSSDAKQSNSRQTAIHKLKPILFDAAI